MNTCMPSACPPESPHPCASRSLAYTPKAGAPARAPAQGALREQGGSGGAGKELELVDFGALGKVLLTSGLAHHCRLVVLW